MGVRARRSVNSAPPGSRFRGNDDEPAREIKLDKTLSSNQKRETGSQKPNMFPLSPAQRRLWVLDRMEGPSTTYSMPAAYWLEGSLDREALGRALEALAERHEPLRTVFAEVDGEPRQVVRPTGFSLEEVDLRKEADPEEALRRETAARMAEPFDLGEGPLFRAVLFRSGRNVWVLFLNLHHIVTDGWSFHIMAREVLALYHAYSSGGASPLPPLPLQYRDYAARQQELLASAEVGPHRDYWLEKLGGEIPVLQIPLDHPRPPSRTYRGKTLTFPWPSSDAEALARFNRDRSASPFITLLALLKVFLYRVAEQEDIVVGTPVAGRLHPDWEGLVGFFANTLALRDRLRGSDSFDEVLAGVRETVLDAYDHQVYPFDRLVSECDVRREVNRHPFFDVMMVFREEEGGKVQLGSLTVAEYPLESPVSRFDLVFQFVRTADGNSGREARRGRASSPTLRLDIVWSTDLFEEETVRRLAACFETLSRNALAAPEKPVDELEMLPPSERAKVLESFNDTARPYPRDRTLADLFQEQVRRTPDAEAILADSRRLTYGELDTLSSGLACYLRDELEVEEEQPVGVMLDRSLENVAGLLGILKAGGAYLPLDPAYPEERLRYMLEDSGCRVVLTDGEYAPVARSAGVRQVVDVEDEEIGWKTAPLPVSPSRTSVPASLAYIVYTSGSTGKPKGVMVEHRGFVNMILDQIRVFGIRPSDRVLQFSSPSFDASLSEIFMTLLSGAALVPVGSEIIKDPSVLLEFMDRWKVTAATLPPVYLNALQRKGLESLRVLVTAGEPANVGDALHYSRRKACFNAYGPTEYSVCATICRVDPDKTYGGSIPIGKPIANTSIYIVNGAFKPVPVGVAGEICIGGDGLARGYLDRPELTEDKFVPNPFGVSGKGEERLYRTGDLGRWLPDGDVEFLGRLDHQVKIRGYRVELGEIEARLLEHPRVRDAVVIPRRRGEGPRELVAYAVVDSRTGMAALRSHLSRSLPGYMIPARFVFLDRLPATPNGKVDRKALPDPERVQEGSRAGHVPPSTPLQEKVAAIWGEVLGARRPGLDDHFFERGGDSLQAVRVAALLSSALEANISPRLLFSNPVLEDFCREAEKLSHGPALAKTREKARRHSDEGQRTETDWEAEAALDEEIHPRASLSSTPPSMSSARRVFLTGATGFVGAFLLEELLKRTRAEVSCLIRADNPQKAQERIKSNLDAYGLWHESFRKRLVPVCGDLAAPLLGLSPEKYRELARSMDVIYHNGAWLHFIHPYEALKPANVAGTEEVLRLACLEKVQPVHFVSTLSVFSSLDGRSGPVKETGPPSSPEGLDGGYARSKWVAERKVLEARRRGLPVNIYRPGRVTGHGRTGVSNTDDLFCRMTKGFIQLGIAPDLPDLEDMTPVDYLARALVHVSLHPRWTGGIFHLVNPRPMPLKELIQWTRSRGYPLTPVPAAEWREELLTRLEKSPENALYPFLPLFREALSTGTAPRFDCGNTLQALEGTGIVCPPVDGRLLAVYFDYFARTGFLDRPQRQER